MQHDLEQEQEDIRAAGQGDEVACTRLMERYQPIVAQQMWRFTRDRHEHEYLVQDVFIQVFLNLKGYKARAPFLHWVRRIATNTGYRYWKKQGRDTEKHRRYQQEKLSDLPAETATPSEAGEYLHVLLETLPPEERLVLTLMYFDERSTKEVAADIGWSTSNVKVRAFRARKKLKALLEEHGYGTEQRT